MSLRTWTPNAVASEAEPAALALWRAVEAQHVVATRALVDSQAEQELLEAILDTAKPPVPEACAHLDYLLSTPFRYPPTRYGSRFRSLSDPGVWYGAEQLRTSCAELGYWRWRFVTDSQGLERLDGVPHTIFQATAQGSTIDLRREPFARARSAWTNPVDYAACQAFARSAREARVNLLRYESVRDPEHAGCAAVLACTAFGKGAIRNRQTWFLTVDGRRASWIRASGRRAGSHDFSFG